MKSRFSEKARTARLLPMCRFERFKPEQDGAPRITMADFWIKQGWYKTVNGKKRFTFAKWREGVGVQREAVRFLVENVLQKDPREVTLKDFRSNGLYGLLLKRCGGSPHRALEMAGYDLRDGMERKPRGYFESKERRVAATEGLVRRLGKEPREMQGNDFSKNGLYGLFQTYYHGSAYEAVLEAGLVTEKDGAYMRSKHHGHGDSK